MGERSGVMPYYIAKNREGCSSGWAVVGQEGKLHGCHTTKQSAIDQAVAISLSTKEPFKGERATDVAPRDDIQVGTSVKWEEITGEEYYGIVTELQGGLTVVALYDEEEGVWYETGEAATAWTMDLEVIPNLFSEALTLTQRNEEPSNEKWIRAAWAIKARIENLPVEARSIGGQETRTNHIELRATGDGMTFEGYGAVFNSQSEDLGFREVIKPGAFRNSLKTRNRMMLLWNHDASQPLASTRNGSLKLTEDGVGLKVQAKLPDTTLGRDIAELVKTGVIDAMSFGFRVKKDSWSNDGQVRTLEEVVISEVSLVSFPAYEGTAGKVSVRAIDPEKLGESLGKLEAGEALDASEAELLHEVVGKLTPTTEVEEPAEDLLTVKKLKLQLIEKGL